MKELAANFYSLQDPCSRDAELERDLGIELGSGNNSDQSFLTCQGTAKQQTNGHDD